MVRAAAIMCLLTLHAGAENLLANPGFDELRPDGKPKRWDLFVMLAEGAYGRLDDVAAEGGYSAMLHNPEVYSEEPANNWSQHVIAQLGGKELIVSGFIKTDEATEAAFWLQCWEKTPLRVLSAVTSSTDSPMYGTQDWTEVKMEVTVPEGTDFLILRCVLKGSGTAWFDSVRLAHKGEEDSEDAQASEEGEGEAPGDAPGVPGAIKDLKEANAAMSKAVQALRETNESLMAQIRLLQEQLNTLRATGPETRTTAPPASAVPRPKGATLSAPPARGIPRPKGPSSLGISPRAQDKGVAPPAKRGHPLIPRDPNRAKETP